MKSCTSRLANVKTVHLRRLSSREPLLEVALYIVDLLARQALLQPCSQWEGHSSGELSTMHLPSACLVGPPTTTYHNATVKECFHGAKRVGEHFTLSISKLVVYKPVTRGCFAGMVIGLAHSEAQLAVDIQAFEWDSRATV